MVSSVNYIISLSCSQFYAYYISRIDYFNIIHSTMVYHPNEFETAVTRFYCKVPDSLSESLARARLCPPHSFRKQFSVEGDEVNPLHGSDSIKTAEEELSYFFPMEHTVGIIKPSAMSNKGWLTHRDALI